MSHYPTVTTDARTWIPAPTVTGGSTIARDEEERVFALDDITSTLGGANHRLNELIANMREHADGIFGANPSKDTGTAGNAPKQSGRLTGLRDGVQITHELISQLEREFVRLRAL